MGQRGGTIVWGRNGPTPTVFTYIRWAMFLVGLVFAALIFGVAMWQSDKR